MAEHLRALSIFMIGNQNLLSSNWKYKTKLQKIKEIVITNKRSLEVTAMVEWLMAEHLRALSIFMIGNQNLLSSNWKYKTKLQKIKEIVITNKRSLKVTALRVGSFSSRSNQYKRNSFRFLYSFSFICFLTLPV